MNVFVAGGSGTIGIPLVRSLVAAGHHVTAMTRTSGNEERLRAIGASIAIADALDRDALTRAVAAAHPTHVVHELTALPKTGVSRASELEPTNRLRVDGTRNLLDAAIAAGAKRFLAGSFAMLAPRSSAPSDADNPAAAAIRSMETQVLDAGAKGAIEGIVLRYGLFYGRDVPSTVNMIASVRKRRLPIVRGDTGELPLIHVDDAVAATVLALDRAPAGSTYDIVDDRPVSLSEIVATIAEFSGAPAPWRVPAWIPRLVAPYMAGLLSMRLPLSNAKARAELGWRPDYPTIREGLAFTRAAERGSVR
jgi:nucleoside-diphosphate-sugar epimerase